MPDLYDKIMQQPKKVRRRIAFGVTTFFGFILISLWLLVASNRIQNVFNESAEIDETGLSSSKNPSLKESFNEMLNLVNETSEIKKDITEQIDETETIEMEINKENGSFDSSEEKNKNLEIIDINEEEKGRLESNTSPYQPPQANELNKENKPAPEVENSPENF